MRSRWQIKRRVTTITENGYHNRCAGALEWDSRLKDVRTEMALERGAEIGVMNERPGAGVTRQV